ncbi:UvrD-helicase domain-containing protein [Metabacillus indicus]|uniref:UvrD-helicase domain-containing protein n=1 Tax=Metabacillus indicus TaxID=246786 RepID=UPI003CEAD1A2
MLFNNQIIIAAAGSGKTKELVSRAIDQHDKRILITTFTIDNAEEIRKKFYKEIGYIPSNVKIQTWFSFLLNDGVRPYQNTLYDKQRIENIEFVNGQSTRFVAKKDIENYYLKLGKRIYTDKMCDFIGEVFKRSKGAVIKRLESIYDVIMIDEVQDLAGYDLEFLYVLLRSKINIVVVGDNRQAVFFTNSSSKNKRKKGEHIFELFKEWETKGICTIEYKTECYRSNQSICDFADLFYPDMPKTHSLNTRITGHDGLFYIRSKDIDRYIDRFNPQILRYSKVSKVPSNYLVYNFGKSKGLTFDRVLVICNGPLNKFLKSGDLSLLDKSKAAYYVAITRARYSVTFVTDEKEITGQLIREYLFEKEEHVKELVLT